MKPMRKVNYQPDGMNTVNPYLMVNRVDHLIGFIETVFDGRLRLKPDRLDGSIMHAEVANGDSIIMMVKGAIPKDSPFSVPCS